MKFFRCIASALLFAAMISSALSAPDPSVLFEKALYTEEILGNVNEAIKLYQQVIAAADASRDTAAQATFRLGMCYRKINRSSDAQAAFSKLVNLYPEQRNLISKIPGASPKGTQLRPTPWVDGEILQFVERPADEKGSMEALTAEYSVESVRLNDKMVWKLQCLRLVPMTGELTGAGRTFQFSTVYMNPGNLMPISSTVKVSAYLLGILVTKYIHSYTPGVIDQSTLKSNGEATNKRLALDREVYDYYQLEMILRSLPLRDGFQTTIPVAFEKGPLDVKITVPAREKITVPAGTFECYKVVANATEQVAVYWISADANAYIVKFDQGDFHARELKSIKKIDHAKSSVFEDRELGIRITAPSSWYVSHAWSSQSIRIIEPEAEIDGRLELLPPPEGGEGNDPSKLLDSIVTRDASSSSQRAVTGYKIRPGTQIELTVSGLPAIRYVADSNRALPLPIVYYTHYFARSNKVYQLVFRMRAKAFDGMKPILDAVVKSIVVQ